MGYDDEKEGGRGKGEKNRRECLFYLVLFGCFVWIEG